MANSTQDRPHILPYSALVGQQQIRDALELAYVNPAIGGVLITGPRGTAKSTAVRAFTMMASGQLPVTLPLGATEDRVLGGWNIEALLKGVAQQMQGLLQEAAASSTRILYVDEINLLDDHLVDVILDAAASGILHAEREGLTETVLDVDFTLIGTMNPDEGGLRAQLLDRFGLVAHAEAQDSDTERTKIIKQAMRFETARHAAADRFWQTTSAQDAERRSFLEAARDRLPHVSYSDIIGDCAKLASELGVVGNRGPLALIHAGRAWAAITGSDVVTREHLKKVARPALIHRRAKNPSDTESKWKDEDDKTVNDVLVL